MYHSMAHILLSENSHIQRETDNKESLRVWNIPE